MSEDTSQRSCGPSQKKNTDKLNGRDDMDTDNNDMGKSEQSAASNVDIPDCAVCLQSCVHPVQLPCSHVFCFLCMKGASTQYRRCALCRQAIPVDFFNSPKLLTVQGVEILPVETSKDEDRYTWFYEGRNGWWQYDERTNVELEESYGNKKRTFELLIAGYVYVIDLDSMLQYRRSDPSRRRRIKRDLVSAPKKGIAGLKIKLQREEDSAERQVVDGAEEGKSAGATGGVAQAAAPVNSGIVASTDGDTHDGADPLKTQGVSSSAGSDEEDQIPCPNVNHSNSTANETVYEVVRQSHRTNSNEQSPPSYGYNTHPSSNENSPTYALSNRQRRRQLDTPPADDNETSRAGLTQHASQNSWSANADSTTQDHAIHHQRTHSAPETRQSARTSNRPRYPAPPIPPRSQTNQVRIQVQARTSLDNGSAEAPSSEVSSREQQSSQLQASSAAVSSTRQRHTRRRVHEV